MNKDFGKTFAGFFSDEPEMGNVCGEYGHNACIGQATMEPAVKQAVGTILKRKLGQLTLQKSDRAVTTK